MDFRAQIYLPTFEDTIVQGRTNIDGDLSDCEGVVVLRRWEKLCLRETV